MSAPPPAPLPPQPPLATEMSRLLREGDDIGTWKETGNSHAPKTLYEQAGRLRTRALDKYNAGTIASLKEAFVLMLRFTKFYEVVKACAAVDRKAEDFFKLQRDVMTYIGMLEELKPRLAKLLDETSLAASEMSVPPPPPPLPPRAPSSAAATTTPPVALFARLATECDEVSGHVSDGVATSEPTAATSEPTRGGDGVSDAHQVHMSVERETDPR